MARLQRKKSPGSKKKKQGEAEGKPAESAPASDSTASAAPIAKKKAYSVSRRPSAAAVKTKSEPSGKIQGWWGQSMQFLREVKVELKKVAWPSRKQTVGSTLVVLVLVFIISAFLGVVDMGLSSLVRLVLH